MHDIRQPAHPATTGEHDDRDIRILRRVLPLDALPLAPHGDGPFRRVIVLDTETTGTDFCVDEVIDLAIVTLEVDPAGEIVSILSAGQALRDPCVPIPPVITKITGITDADVAGKSIDLDRLEHRLRQADLLVAHNCSFDLAFIENLVPAISGAAWACSAADIDWLDHGFDGKKLNHLIMQAGMFADAHRAMSDVVALINLLAYRLEDGSTPLRHLLAAADRTTVRFEATGAPFDTRSILKSAGYRWDPRRHVWWRQIEQHECADEERWFRQHIAPHGPAPRMTTMTSRERHR
jgi:DNA polymerase-3 subunit epsilon